MRLVDMFQEELTKIILPNLNTGHLRIRQTTGIHARRPHDAREGFYRLS